MQVTLVVHIVAGGFAIVLGFVALYAAKGATLHRRSGMLFVWAMLVMSLLGALIAAVRGVWLPVNVSAGVLTAYLVATGLITIRPLDAPWRWLQPALMLVALAVGLTCLRFGIEALAQGGQRDGIPAFPYLLFGVVGSLAGVLDLRMMRSGGLQGAARLARHLWRMCFALLIAAMSFFLGQADEFPEALRIPALLALPVLAVLLSMLYWLWRVRIRRSFRAVLRAASHEAA